MNTTLIGLLIFFGLAFVILLIVNIVFVAPKQRAINQENTRKKQEEEQRKKQEIIDWVNDYKSSCTTKFGDEISNRIFNENEWLEMKEIEIIAMYGEPTNIEETKSKDKLRRVFSYSLMNPNTSRMTVNKFTFDNDSLVKIDVKIPQRKVWEGGVINKLQYPASLS